MGPDMAAAVQANLSRRMVQTSGSTAAGTSAGGETRPWGAGEPPQKRQHLEPEEVDETIPQYVHELIERLSPAQSPLMQNVWDDAVLLLDAEARRIAGPAGMSGGGAIARGADVEAEAASRRLDADVDAVVAVLSDEDTDFLLQLTRDDAPRSA
jgi:hypothetical protein